MWIGGTITNTYVAAAASSKARASSAMACSSAIAAASASSLAFCAEVAASSAYDHHADRLCLSVPPFPP